MTTHHPREKYVPFYYKNGAINIIFREGTLILKPKNPHYFPKGRSIAYLVTLLHKLSIRVGSINNI